LLSATMWAAAYIGECGLVWSKAVKFFGRRCSFIVAKGGGHHIIPANSTFSTERNTEGYTVRIRAALAGIFSFELNASAALHGPILANGVILNPEGSDRISRSGGHKILRFAEGFVITMETLQTNCTDKT